MLSSWTYTLQHQNTEYYNGYVNNFENVYTVLDTMLILRAYSYTYLQPMIHFNMRGSK